MEAYKHLFDNALEYARAKSQNIAEQVSHALDKLAVNFGIEILKIVPGRVSTEIDARLSYDTEATLKKCYELKKLYEGMLEMDVSDFLRRCQPVHGRIFWSLRLIC